MGVRSDPAPADAVAALVGETLSDGRYAVSGVLGSGSQGATLEAVDKKDGRLVAIKRFQVRGARSWKDVELAEREARVLSQLSHPLLPEALAHFEEDGALYLVMEKVEGPTLSELGTVDRADVLRFLNDAAEVLDYLHTRSPPVIHRDVKPGNVIRRPADDDGPARHMLVDFGSVRDTLKPAGGSTVVGTFGYMAPEQLQGRALPATDVYAVGATALRMLTGIEPEHMPHKGLAIDVEKALGERGTPWVRALAAMVEPDPDERAATIGPLLASLQPDESKRRNPKRERKRDKRKRRQDKRERRQQQRVERHARRGQQDGVLLPWPLRVFITIGLSVAQVAVALALHVVVPTVLTLLSLVFGKGLRTAAKEVNRAGRHARLALRQAARFVQGHPSASKQADGGRIELDDKPRVRIDEEVSDVDAEIAEAIHEAEQAVEEAVAEAERKLKR
jgi:hypothetical protein